MTKVLKQRLLMRVLCLLLSLFLIIMPILIPAAEAIFIESAATAYVYELVASALVVGGFVVANADDLIAISAAAADWMKGTPVYEKLMGIARNALSFAGDITKMAWRMSTEAWNLICDAITHLGFGSGSIIFPGDVYLFDNFSNMDSVINSIDFVTSNIQHVTVSQGSKTVTYDLQQVDSGTWNLISYFNGQNGSSTISSVYPLFFTFDAYDGAYDPYSFRLSLSYYTSTVKLKKRVSIYANVNSSPVTVSLSESVPVSGDLTYTGDQTLVLAPPLPTTAADPDDGTETVIIPPISTYPDDWTMDFPKTDTGDMVDVPTDTLVDAGTGTKVDVNNPDIPDNPSGTVDWPSTGDLSIPELIVSKFPFCIPFDVARMIGVLQADPVAPVFRFPLKYGAILDEEIVLDLSRWDDVIRVIRWGELICFVAGLAYVTKTYIKW